MTTWAWLINGHWLAVDPRVAVDALECGYIVRLMEIEEVLRQ